MGQSGAGHWFGRFQAGKPIAYREDRSGHRHDRADSDTHDTGLDSNMHRQRENKNAQNSITVSFSESIGTSSVLAACLVWMDPSPQPSCFATPPPIRKPHVGLLLRLFSPPAHSLRTFCIESEGYSHNKITRADIQEPCGCF